MLCHSEAMLYHYTATVNFKRVRSSSFLISLPILLEWILIHISAVFFISRVHSTQILMTNPYLIYRGGERYKGATH